MTVQLRRSKVLWVAGIAALCAGACSPSGPADDDGMSIGGTSATGGGPGVGGNTISAGGATAVGGRTGSGGRLSSSGGAASGGVSAGGTGAGGRGAGVGGANDGSGGAVGGAAAAGGATAAGGGATTCTPEPNCEPTPPDTGDFHEDCLARINQFRTCLCLTPLVRHTEGEDCASEQAQYDFENDSYHAGIRAKICAPANLNNAAQNECPGYPSVDSTIGLCNQQMFDEGECEDFEVCGHYLNMMDPEAKSVACGYYETPSGDVWMVENFYF